MSETMATRLGPVGMVTLRGYLADPRLIETVREATGCDMPETRRVVFAGESGVAWMSPDELMLFSPRDVAADRAAAISRAMGAVHHLSVDVSDARTVFRVEGPGAREVLAKGAPVDLSPAAFGTGDLRRTRLGQVAAAFWMSAPETFDLMCFRSVEDFVSDWLALATAPGSLPGFFQT